MKDNFEKKKPSKSEEFRNFIKNMCSDISQNIESKAEREYLQRKYHITSKCEKYRERTRRIKNICKRSRKKSAKI